MRRWLEIGANVATLVVAAAVIGLVISQYQQGESVPPRPPAAYVAGDVILDTPELNLGQAELTILVGTASTCRFCTASMPFYQRLADQVKKKGAKLIAYTLEDVELNRQYLESHNIHPDGVVSASANGLSLPATPQLIVARRDGTVVGTWRGN